MCAGDEWKAAFSTTSGHYQYNVMACALVNSPAIFQAFMNEIFRDMLSRFVIKYLDDILIHSSTYSEHIKHLRLVLQCLCVHGLYAKAEKCKFHQRQFSFLSYHLGPQGVGMEDSKLAGVDGRPESRLVKNYRDS